MNFKGIAAAFASSLLLGVPARPRAAEAPATVDRVRVSAKVLVTPGSGATYPMWFGMDADAVEPARFHVTMHPDSSGGMRGQQSVATPTGPLPENGWRWDVVGELRRASIDSIELSLAWRRLEPAPGGGERVVAEGRRDVTLPENKGHLIDFVDLAASRRAPTSAHNAALEILAAPAEDETLAERRVAYDLWLVDEADGKRGDVRRWQVIAKQGEKIPFDFERLRWQFQDAPAAIETRVEGSFRGRVRADGKIDVAIAAVRSTGSSARDWMLASGGDKRVAMSSGETVRVELPPPDLGRVGPPESARVDALAGLLHGHTLALVLTATVLND
jgi:hypothetical protein